MKTAQEKQGYRVKSAQPVCGNCSYCLKVHLYNDLKKPQCNFGELFPIDLIHGTCLHFEWRK